MDTNNTDDQKEQQKRLQGPKITFGPKERTQLRMRARRTASTDDDDEEDDGFQDSLLLTERKLRLSIDKSIK